MSLMKHGGYSRATRNRRAEAVGMYGKLPTRRAQKGTEGIYAGEWPGLMGCAEWLTKLCAMPRC